MVLIISNIRKFFRDYVLEAGSWARYAYMKGSNAPRRNICIRNISLRVWYKQMLHWWHIMQALHLLHSAFFFFPFSMMPCVLWNHPYLANTSLLLKYFRYFIFWFPSMLSYLLVCLLCLTRRQMDSSGFIYCLVWFGYILHIINKIKSTKKQKKC